MKWNFKLTVFELTVPDLYLVNDFKLGFMFLSTFNVSRLWVQDKGNLICIALRHFLEGRRFFYTQCHNCAAWSGDYFYCHTYRSLLLLEEAVDVRPYIQISSWLILSRNLCSILPAPFYSLELFFYLSHTGVLCFVFFAVYSSVHY